MCFLLGAHFFVSLWESSLKLKLKNSPFIAPLAGFILGILLADQFFIKALTSNTIFFILIFLLIIASLFWKKETFTLLIFFFFIVLGYGKFRSYNHTSQIPDFLMQKELNLKLKIIKDFRSSENFYKYKAEIISIDTSNFSNSYVLLYVKKNNVKLFNDDEIWIKSTLLNNQKPLNFHQFDYSKYLERKKIHYSTFVDTIHYRKINKNSINYFTSKFKDKIHQKLLDFGYNQHTTDIISAIILGNRTDMDKNIEENYRKTGVIHILSISGLHVMIVYSIFYFLLAPISRLKNGKQTRVLLSLILIWSFVILVGFQPPVLRSALMILVFHIAIVFKRQPNFYHSLVLSAFILLLFNPNFLFEVGFQLSFSAVFFIVYLHPIYQKIFQPKGKFSKIAIGFIGTSFSAQLGTLPFTIYYFNQTSGLFLAGNVVMVAAAYLMIIGGMFSILLIEIGIHCQIWTSLFNEFVWACNYYIESLSNLDFLVFDTIRFKYWESILVFIGILYVRILLFNPKYKTIVFGLLLLISFEGQRVYSNYHLSRRQEIIVFHENKNSILGIRKGKEMDIFVANPQNIERIKTYLIRPYLIQEKIKKVKYFNMDETRESFYVKDKNTIKFNEEEIHFINKTDLLSNVNAKYLLIQNNANWKHNLSETQIIIDGSNSFQNDLSSINIWQTRVKGAYLINVK